MSFPAGDGSGPADAPSAGVSASAAMVAALAAAAEAGARGEVPVGAVLLGPGGGVVCTAANEVEASGDVSAHAELLAMRRGSALLGRTRLADCTLVVSLEPCAMCAGAAVHFRIGRLVFGAYDPKGGGVEHGARVFAQAGCLHRPEVIGGVRERDSATLLRAFFEDRRAPSPTLRK